jgi:plasmid replication initiation protein
MAATSYEILTFIGRGTGASDYQRLKAALERLKTITVVTSPLAVSATRGGNITLEHATLRRSIDEA